MAFLSTKLMDLKFWFVPTLVPWTCSNVLIWNLANISVVRWSFSKIFLLKISLISIYKMPPHLLFNLLDLKKLLGGLSLHLNHLIAWHVGISFWQFGTLPIGNFLSNLDSRHLMTSPRTLFGQFWHMSIFGDSRAIRVICQKKMPSENQFFLDEGVMGHQSVLGFVGGQVPTLYSGTIFGGVWPTEGVQGGIERKMSVFPYICDSLEGTRHWLIWSRISL